jgi:protein O-mannosyl-transferase
MNPTSPHRRKTRVDRTGWWLLFAAFALTVAVYWPGLSGGFLFDDYPNIVDNHGVQPQDASFSSLVGAALSSPSSEFKRPLASLSFAANYLITGIDPYWMKLTNLVTHLLNGLLVFLLTAALLSSAFVGAHPVREIAEESRTGCTPTTTRAGTVAALVAAGWMLLPINLTGVLYVVQRMESMANLFVLLGLLGYVEGRRRMLEQAADNDSAPFPARRGGLGWGRFSISTRGFILCFGSIVACAGVGLLAKETAIMLPLYAALIEWTVFRFHTRTGQRDNRLLGMFLVMLLLPMILGLVWLLPQVFDPAYWSTRDFGLRTRLLSEARIVVDYIRWTLLPTPDALSFYHDDFRISTGLLTPWTTFASIASLCTLAALMIWLRQRQPLAALGIGLFFGCQLLTGTILPLELIYEHRNYFASFGVLLALMPLLAVPRTSSFALPRHVLLAGLFLCWTALTAFTSYAWGNPLRLAEDLASRAPQSPRAQYELGRTYIIYSHYEPTSPFTSLAYAPLETAASLPGSSILPEQALIFMNARMHLPLKDAWWDSLTTKLKAHRPGVQDESSLGALTQCARERRCDLPTERMIQAFLAALSYPSSSARLLATYGDYAWNVLDDHALGERMTMDAVKASPNEPAYQITLIRMLAAQGHRTEAAKALQKLGELNIGGRLNSSLNELRTLPSLQIDAAVKPD